MCFYIRTLRGGTFVDCYKSTQKNAFWYGAQESEIGFLGGIQLSLSNAPTQNVSANPGLLKHQSAIILKPHSVEVFIQTVLKSKPTYYFSPQIFRRLLFVLQYNMVVCIHLSTDFICYRKSLRNTQTFHIPQ